MKNRIRNFIFLSVILSGFVAAAEKPVRIEGGLAANIFFHLDKSGVPSVFAGRNGYVMLVSRIVCGNNRSGVICQASVTSQPKPIRIPANELLSLFAESGITVQPKAVIVSGVENLLCQLMKEHTYCSLTDKLAP